MKTRDVIKVIIFDEATMSERVLKEFSNSKSASAFFFQNMYRPIYLTINGVVASATTTPAYTRMIEKYS